MSETSVTDKQNLKRWWGRFDVKTEESLLWSIGSFNLYLLRCEKEWRVRHRQNAAEGLKEEVWSVKDNIDIDSEEGEVKRYIFSHTEDQLNILPRLADRPVVVNALTPLYVQPGQQVEMYVSTPLWFSMNVHADQSELLDLPIIRPSDTWFGPSTLKGQLCYASATHGHLSLDDLQSRPHRAMTLITIKIKPTYPCLWLSCVCLRSTCRYSTPVKVDCGQRQ